MRPKASLCTVLSSALLLTSSSRVVAAPPEPVDNADMAASDNAPSDTTDAPSEIDAAQSETTPGDQPPTSGNAEDDQPAAEDEQPAKDDPPEDEASPTGQDSKITAPKLTPSSVPPATTDANSEFSTELTRRERIVYGVFGGVLSAGGLALAGYAGYTISRSLQLKSRLDSLLAEDPEYIRRDELGPLEGRLQDRIPIIDEGRRYNRIAIATGIPAGIALGTGVAMIFLAARRPAKSQLSLTLSRRMAGFSFRTRF